MPGFGAHLHPFEFALQCFAPLALLFLFLFETLGLLVEPAGIVTLPRDTLAAVEFENPARHVVEEVTVVGYRDDRAGVLLQVLFEPVDAFCVEVVGGFVEQQHVGLLEQQPAQRHAAAFSSGEVGHRFVGIGAAEGVHGPFEHAVEFPAVYVIYRFGQFALPFDEFGHLVVVHRFHEPGVHFLVFFQQCHGSGAALLHHFLHRFRIVQFRVLFEVAHAVTRRKDHFALVALVDACNDFHQRRFSRAVEADDAYFRPVKKRKVNIVKDFFLIVEGLADADHREYDFFVCHRMVVFCRCMFVPHRPERPCGILCLRVQR